MNITHDIKALRIELGLTQAEFGAKVGARQGKRVHRNTVRGWEEGTIPTLLHLQGLVNLGLDRAYLVDALAPAQGGHGGRAA